MPFDPAKTYDPNCEVWGEVDFGEGPVRVRCTQTSRHEFHTCVVAMGRQLVDPAQQKLEV